MHMKEKAMSSDYAGKWKKASEAEYRFLWRMIVVWLSIKWLEGVPLILLSMKQLEHLGTRELRKIRICHKIIFEEKDVFACIPTGCTGCRKYLCYFSLPLVFDILEERSSNWPVEIVASPLKALMNDQVKSLEGKVWKLSVLRGERMKKKSSYLEPNFICVLMLVNLMMDL